MGAHNLTINTVENKMEFYKEHSTEEMAEILGRMSKGGENLTPEELKEISDGLYWLEAAAEDPYNSDYFRTLFRALDNICNYDYLEELAEEKVMNEGNGENLRVCAHCLRQATNIGKVNER